jgi:hypothetical protein
MVQALSKSSEPRVINSQEERPLAEWQQLYPDLWLLLEITEEDEAQPRLRKQRRDAVPRLKTKKVGVLGSG